MSDGALSLLGVLFGMQHATEADHLAAVATLVAREKQLGPAVRQGVFRGFGHSLTLLLFGGAVMVVGIALSDRWTHALEWAVGVMLVYLGADLVRRLWRERLHFHAHAHEGDAASAMPHFHAHSHKGRTRTAVPHMSRNTDACRCALCSWAWLTVWLARPPWYC